MLRRLDVPSAGYLFATVLLLTAPAAVASAPDQQEAAPEQAEQVRERVQEMRLRLELTDEQIEAVTPILQTAAEATAEVLREHGIDPGEGGAGRMRPRQLRRLQGDLRPVRDRTLEQLAEVLSEAQLEEYRKIQEETRQALRRRRGRG